MTAARRTFLVTGVRAPAALEIIRRLGRAGHDVLAADSVHAPVGRFSRYARRYFRVPGPRENPTRYLAALREIVLAENVDVLLPACEEIYYISRYRETLTDVCEVFCAEFSTLETLHHKERFARLTHTLGGPVTAPESVLVRDDTHRQTFVPQSREWVFKPVYSRFSARTLVRPAAEGVAGLALDPANPWLAQRFVAGRELSSYGIAVGGRLTAHTLYHSRHRAGQAAGMYFVPEENAAALGFVERLAAQLGFTGQIAFDFMVCGETGRTFVLECNPRLTSGVHLLHAGFDLDGALRGEGGAPADSAVGTGAKMLGAAMLLHGLTGAVAAGNLAGWLRDFAAGEDVVSARDDRLPVVGQLAFLGEVGALGLWRRTGVMEAMTADFEWNGQTLP